MGSVSDFKFLIKTSRPITWPPMLLIILYSFGLSKASIGLMEIGLLSIFTLPANLIVYGLNDIYDYESDKENPRKSNPDPQRRSETLKLGMFLSAIYGAVIVLLTGKAPVIGSYILWLVGSYVYSVPPIRLKERPPLDGFINSLYVIVPTLASLGLYSEGIPAEYLWVAAAVPGGHAYSTIPDYEADKQAGHKTFAVRFGRKPAVLYALFSVLTLLIYSPISSGIFNAYTIFAIITCIYAYLHLKQREKLERSFWLLYITGNIIGVGAVLSINGFL